MFFRLTVINYKSFRHFRIFMCAHFQHHRASCHHHWCLPIHSTQMLYVCDSFFYSRVFFVRWAWFRNAFHVKLIWFQWCGKELLYHSSIISLPPPTPSYVLPISSFLVRILQTMVQIVVNNKRAVEWQEERRSINNGKSRPKTWSIVLCFAGLFYPP